MPDILTNVRAAPVLRARRLLQAKFRKEDGLLLAEGPQACREAVTYARVHTFFVTSAAAQRYKDIVSAAQAAGAQLYVCSDEVLAAVSDTVTPQGMTAVVEIPHSTLREAITSQSRLVVALTSVRDPGNAGAVLRVADAVGADAVVVCGDSVEMANPKVVRASAGSLFHLPVVEDVTIEDVVSAASHQGLQVLAADGSGGPLGEGHDLARPTVWVFGNEAWGMPQDVQNIADHVVRIPIYGKAESLNLATAAAVCLYATATAQRTAN